MRLLARYVEHLEPGDRLRVSSLNTTDAGDAAVKEVSDIGTHAIRVVTSLGVIVWSRGDVVQIVKEEDAC